MVYSPKRGTFEADACDRTLFVSKAGLENAKRAVEAYKKGEVREMTPEVWRAKKVVDATLHPGMFALLLACFRTFCVRE